MKKYIISLVLVTIFSFSSIASIHKNESAQMYNDIACTVTTVVVTTTHPDGSSGTATSTSVECDTLEELQELNRLIQQL